MLEEVWGSVGEVAFLGWTEFVVRGFFFVVGEGIVRDFLVIGVFVVTEVGGLFEVGFVFIEL